MTRNLCNTPYCTRFESNHCPTCNTGFCEEHKPKEPEEEPAADKTP